MQTSLSFGKSFRLGKSQLFSSVHAIALTMGVLKRKCNTGLVFPALSDVVVIVSVALPGETSSPTATADDGCWPPSWFEEARLLEIPRLLVNLSRVLSFS